MSADQYLQFFLKLALQLQKQFGMQQQPLTPIPITQHLSQLFPDIEDQLCSRHSTLFSKLKTNFNRLYDNMEPQYYVVVKGDCQIMDQDILETRMSMGMENGIIVLVSKTYRESQLFINSNHFSQQLIFTQHGDLQQGLNNLSPDITTIIKSCNQSLSPSQLFGGIFYIHANIPEDRFHYNQLLLMAVYLGMMVVNDRLGKVDKDNVIRNMARLECMGSQQTIRRRFDGFVNLGFDITVTEHKNDYMVDIGNQDNTDKEITQTHDVQLQLQPQLQPPPQTLHYHPNLPSDYKLMFCRLDLGKQDMRYQKVRRVDVRNRKNQLLRQITKQFPQITSLLQLSQSTINLQKQLTFTSTYIRSQQAKTVEQLQCEDEQEILRQPDKFLNSLITTIKVIQRFLKNPNQIQSLITTLWHLQSIQLQLYTQDVIDLVQRMKHDLNIKACMIVDHNFLMILVHKNKHTELLVEVKHKMNKGQLKSKSLFKIEEEDIVQQRFHIDKAIGEKLFTTVPSKGVAIFDPSQAIWFL